MDKCCGNCRFFRGAAEAQILQPGSCVAPIPFAASARGLFAKIVFADVWSKDGVSCKAFRKRIVRQPKKTVRLVVAPMPEVA
jgi:hypothetical protein